MDCPYCKGVIGSHTNYCAHCGKRIIPPIVAGTIAELIGREETLKGMGLPTKCGTEEHYRKALLGKSFLEYGVVNKNTRAKFCIDCGAKLPEV